MELFPIKTVKLEELNKCYLINRGPLRLVSYGFTIVVLG